MGHDKRGGPLGKEKGPWECTRRKTRDAKNTQKARA